MINANSELVIYLLREKLTKLKLRSKDFGLFSSAMGSIRCSSPIDETGLEPREELVASDEVSGRAPLLLLLLPLVVVVVVVVVAFDSTDGRSSLSCV